MNAITKPSLKSLLKSGDMLVAPGIFDGITLRVAEKIGFDALYMTGYGTVASHLGLPDAGLASYRDMVERVRLFAGLSKSPMLCDGDTGYGGLLNVEHTIKGYEAAGASAIQLEDQEFPKKCGHTPGRKVIPIDQAAAKIKVAAEARDSKDFLIVARTDARTNYGLDEALRRGEAFAKAGADILFIESPESEAEMERICAAFDLPLLVNVVEGGSTPVLSKQRYIELGYQMAIYPALAFLAVGKVVESVYGHLKTTGSSVGTEDKLADFMTFSRTMGFEDIWSFERAHAGLEEAAE
jgi:2-methylisocitrate lyase-like PEP mutase family enzyme